MSQKQPPPPPRPPAPRESRAPSFPVLWAFVVVSFIVAVASCIAGIAGGAGPDQYATASAAFAALLTVALYLDRRPKFLDCRPTIRFCKACQHPESDHTGQEGYDPCHTPCRSCPQKFRCVRFIPGDTVRFTTRIAPHDRTRQLRDIRRVLDYYIGEGPGSLSPDLPGVQSCADWEERMRAARNLVLAELAEQ